MVYELYGSSEEEIKTSVVANIATTASDGKTFKAESLNLNMINPVGYRVNSMRVSHLRIWDTKQLKELITKDSLDELLE